MCNKKEEHIDLIIQTAQELQDYQLAQVIGLLKNNGIKKTELNYIVKQLKLPVGDSPVVPPLSIKNSKPDTHRRFKKSS